MTLPDGMALPVKLTPARAARMVLGFAVLVALIGAVGAVLREPIATFSARLVADYGVVGLFGALVVTDHMPGLGFQPVMFLGYTGGVGPGVLLLVSWLATLCASVTAYTIGCGFRDRPALVDFLLRWRIGHWLRAYNARAIAVAAVAPFPFVLATFGAGVMGVGLRDLLVGASFRGVKLAFTLGAIMAGWGIGA